MSNPGKKIITFNVTPEQLVKIKTRAAHVGSPVSQYVLNLIRRDMSKELALQPLPEKVPEMDHYFCPICKESLEETDRRDRIDTYGDNHYHSMELQLECTNCRLGHAVILQFPYMD